MTPTKRRFDFLMQRSHGLKPSQLTIMWLECKNSHHVAVRAFGEWAFAMAMLKLRCCKSMHSYNRKVVQLACYYMDKLGEEMLEPCGLIRIPLLKKAEPKEDIDEL